MTLPEFISASTRSAPRDPNGSRTLNVHHRRTPTWKRVGLFVLVFGYGSIRHYACDLLDRRYSLVLKPSNDQGGAGEFQQQSSARRPAHSNASIACGR
jgi:hypothetical protein